MHCQLIMSEQNLCAERWGQEKTFYAVVFTSSEVRVLCQAVVTNGRRRGVQTLSSSFPAKLRRGAPFPWPAVFLEEIQRHGLRRSAVPSALAPLWEPGLEALAASVLVFLGRVLWPHLSAGGLGPTVSAWGALLQVEMCVLETNKQTDKWILVDSQPSCYGSFFQLHLLIISFTATFFSPQIRV